MKKEMSFLKIRDPNKRDETVKEFLDLKNRIKDNFRQERIEEIETQSDLSKFLKPVTEMQKATAKEIAEQLKPIRESIESLPQAIAFPAYPSIELPKEDILQLGSTAVSALKRFLTKEGADKTFGIYDKDGKFYIGNKEVEIKDNNIIVDNEEYRGTAGLWELVVSKDPNRDIYNPIDHENYRKLLIQTNAMQSVKNPNKPKSNKGTKWKNVVKSIWEGHKKTKGKGVTVIIPEDPNALLERLDLLLSSQEAGRTGVGNELVSICDELKRQGVIDADTYKKLNSYIKM